jgi:hypothetical protein
MLHITVEVVPVEDFVQAVIEGMRRRTNDLAADDP